MQLATFLKSVTPGTKVIAHLGLKRKHYKKREGIKLILNNQLNGNGIEDFSINCYLKPRSGNPNGKNLIPLDPDVINIFLNGPDLKLAK